MSASAVDTNSWRLGDSRTSRVQRTIVIKMPSLIDARSQAWRGTSQNRNFVMTEAHKILADLTEEELPTPARRAVYDFLEKVTNARSVVPSIVPIGGGEVSLHWTVGKRALEVEMCATGPTYLWANDGAGRVTIIEGRASRIESACSAILGRMSSVANRINPGWRRDYLAR